MTNVHRVSHSLFERAIFIDSSALYALQDSRDAHHYEAVVCLDQLKLRALPVSLSTGTIYETYRLTLFRLGVELSLRFLEAVYDAVPDRSLNIERISEQDERGAREFLYRFSDQKITYIDAINFAMMKRMGIDKAFAFDWHYRLLGFVTVPPLFL